MAFMRVHWQGENQGVVFGGWGGHIRKSETSYTVNGEHASPSQDVRYRLVDVPKQFLPVKSDERKFSVICKLATEETSYVYMCKIYGESSRDPPRLSGLNKIYRYTNHEENNIPTNSKKLGITGSLSIAETKFDEAQSAIIAVKPKPITPTRSSGLSQAF
uniref:Uncharacterized protein n=1 Tax=Opuntia streptacantha TaxID=393608 RepID=A0A7C8ZTR6_OPUST